MKMNSSSGIKTREESKTNRREHSGDDSAALCAAFTATDVERMRSQAESLLGPHLPPSASVELGRVCETGPPLPNSSWVVFVYDYVAIFDRLPSAVTIDGIASPVPVRCRCNVRWFSDETSALSQHSDYIAPPPVTEWPRPEDEKVAEWLVRAADACAEQLLLCGLRGVTSVCPSAQRMRDKVLRDEPCLVVFVRHKGVLLGADELLPPSVAFEGHSIAVDVRVGWPVLATRPCATASCRMESDHDRGLIAKIGMYVCDETTQKFSTVGLVLTRGSDHTALLTTGHDYTQGGLAVREGTEQFRVDKVWYDEFGDFARLVSTSKSALSIRLQHAGEFAVPDDSPDWGTIAEHLRTRFRRTGRYGVSAAPRRLSSILSSALCSLKGERALAGSETSVPVFGFGATSGLVLAKACTWCEQIALCQGTSKLLELSTGTTGYAAKVVLQRFVMLLPADNEEFPPFQKGDSGTLLCQADPDRPEAGAEGVGMLRASYMPPGVGPVGVASPISPDVLGDWRAMLGRPHRRRR